jgi:formate hydrogenlyase subunit 3/multisubunit Na+/H+ antiporter MnhD subunit
VIIAAAWLLVAATVLWLLAAALGALAVRRAALAGSALASALGGVAALVGGVLVATHGAGATRTIGAGNLVGAATLRVDPLAAVFVALLGLVALAIGLYAPRYHRPEAGTAAYLVAVSYTI